MFIDEDSNIFILVIKYYSISKVGKEGKEDSNSSKDEVKDVNIITTL